MFFFCNVILCIVLTCIIIIVQKSLRKKKDLPQEPEYLQLRVLLTSFPKDLTLKTYEDLVIGNVYAMGWGDPENHRYRPVTNADWEFVLFLGFDTREIDGALCGYWWQFKRVGFFYDEQHPTTIENINQYV